MKLIFQNGWGEERVIAECKNKGEVVKEMNKFLDSYNYKSPYTRVWTENGRLKLDVGSHTQFFFVEGTTFDEWINGGQKNADEN